MENKNLIYRDLLFEEGEISIKLSFVLDHSNNLHTIVFIFS